jgi:hypothetical protein
MGRQFISTRMNAFDGEWDFDDLSDIRGSISNGDGLLLLDSSVTDFAFSADVFAENREASLALRMQDARNGYLVIFVPRNSRGGNPGLYLVRRADGRETTLTWSNVNLPSVNEWVSLSVVVSGNTFSVFMNGQPMITYTDSDESRIRFGAVGFRIYGQRQSPCSARFRLVMLQPT